MKISNETLIESYRKLIEFLFVIGKYIRTSVHPYRYTVQKKFSSNIFKLIFNTYKSYDNLDSSLALADLRFLFYVAVL